MAATRTFIALLCLTLPLGAVGAYEYATFQDYAVSWPVADQTPVVRNGSLSAGSAVMEFIVVDVNVATVRASVSWSPSPGSEVNLTIAGPDGAPTTSAASSDGRLVLELPVNPVPQVPGIPAPSRLSAETIATFFTGTAGMGTWTVTIRGSEATTPIVVEFQVATYSAILVER